MGELNAAKRETELLAPDLKRITCPVIVIHGTADELVPYENAAFMQKMMTNAKSMRVVDLPPFSVPVSMRVGVGVRG